MSNYKPEVGDRVRVATWPERQFVDVLHVGRELVFGTDADGCEDAWPLHRDPWVKVTARPELPDLPERWIVVHDFKHAPSPSLPYYSSAEDARKRADGMRGSNPHFPRDLAYVKYVPVPDSVVWADELEES